jgi:hypothetical protein
MWGDTPNTSTTDPQEAVGRLRALLVFSNPCRSGAVYTLSKDRANAKQHYAWSVSFIDAFFSLDELLVANNPLGWLCLTLLPIVRIHSPLAYECALQGIYGVLYESKQLLEDAYFQNEKHDTFTPGTIHALRMLSNSTDWQYPGMEDALSLNSAFLFKPLIWKNARGLFNSSDTFAPVVKSTLLIQMPMLRTYPRLPADKDEKLIERGISFNLHSGALVIPQGVKLPYFDPTDPNNIDTTWGVPAIRSSRELIVHSFVRRAARMSLLRNTEFVLHLYGVLDAVFSLYSPRSVVVRDFLSEYLLGCSGHSLNRENMVDPTTPELLEAIPPYDNFPVEKTTDRHVNRLVFTVCLDDFLYNYCGSSGGKAARMLQKPKLESNPATLTELTCLFRKGCNLLSSKISEKNSACLPDVLLHPKSTRSSKTYFKAYAASLAKAMNSVFILVKTAEGGYFRVSDREKHSLFPLLQDVGILLRETDNNIHMHVPRYLNFLMTVGYLGPLANSISALHKENEKVSPRDLLFPSQRQDYLEAMTRLSNPIISDLLDGPLVEFAPSERSLSSYISTVENGNRYFDNRDDASLSRLYVVFGMQGVTNSLIAMYKKLYNTNKVDDSEVPKRKSTAPKHHDARSPLTIPTTLVSKKDNREHRVDLKVLRISGVTYFGLPWGFLREHFGVHPPRPDFVYSSIPACVNLTDYTRYVDNTLGMYADTYRNSLAGINSEFGTIPRQGINLDVERKHLKTFVRVLKGTPYMFSLSGLCKLPSHAWYDRNDPLCVCAELEPFLAKLSNTGYSELRKLGLTYLNNVKTSKAKKEADLAKRATRAKDALKNPDKAMKPTDPRLSFTPEEDAQILALYHPGFTSKDRVNLVRACPGHPWLAIVGRAQLLCERMVAEGETDPTKLPYIRATPRIKKLLEKMDV